MNIPTHFKGKDALGHVIEAQAQGIISASEVHGIEPPGHLSSMADAARETAIILPIIWGLLYFLHILPIKILMILFIFSCGWLLWKMGRSAWLGWFRLERLHRILDQERYEIEHHRQQERDELRVLYAAKGFEGKLLEDVLDVLMADNDRLLKLMVEEELGLSLAAYEHPLKQGLGAAAGVIFSSALCLIGLALWTPLGIFVGTIIAIWCSAALTARLAQNKIIPAVIWNLGLAALAFGCIYFLLQWLMTSQGRL
jgi:vacuolar iron transporter family protein